MRVKAVKLLEGADQDHHYHQNCGDNNNNNKEEEIKNEVVEEEEEEEEDLGGYEWPTPDKCPKSMEDNLTLAQLSKAASAPSSSPSTQGKQKKLKEMKDKLSQPRKRRPSAFKSNYIGHDLAENCVSCKRKKDSNKGLNSPGEVKSPTMIKAEEVRLSLGLESPSFVKLLVRSHVGSCFWMGLPMPFCKLHLPRKDGFVILEDESGEQFEIKYIAGKTGLSAGWRKFAVGHQLLEGDVLVFHLVGPSRFKVYIIRANDLTEVDGALSLLNLDALTKQSDAEIKEDAEGDTTALKTKKRKRQKSLPLTVVQKKNKKTGISRSVPQLGQLVEQSGNDSEEVGSEIVEGSKFSGPAVQFKDIKSFDDFHVLVNGMCIDSELPEHIRIKYYELCCSKNLFLHDSLLPGLYCKLVAGLIGEMVNIADAIRACKLTTSRNEFANWEKSLKSFELLGMNVEFLRARICKLQSLAFVSESASDTKRYIEAKTKQTRAETEIRNLESKLVELKGASEMFGADIESLKSKAESYERKFQEEVDAPW